MKTNKTSDITDADTITAVRMNDREQNFWDDGYGPVWLYESADFDFGIVRARNESDAYECVLDEILPRADWEDVERDYPDHDWDQGDPEGYALSPNNGLCSVPLNGEVLVRLTDQMMSERGIEIEFTRED